MATWDSADLLARCKRFARRPTTDESYPDPDWYASLTEAQAEAITDLAARAPDALYPPPVLLTSADGGKTYTFGTDPAGDLEFPLGHAEIYASLKNIPDEPLEPGLDFIVEGQRIRIPNDRTKTFTDGPYARFVVQPRAIDASTQPTLQPKSARIMIVFKAVEKWASRPGSGADPSYWGRQYDSAFGKSLLALRTQYNMAAAQAQPQERSSWALSRTSLLSQ
jgi:hypothetical protein